MPGEYILGPPDDDSDPIMPLGKVHIIGGASGAGKTTLTFQLLKAMNEGGEFFGLPTANHPLVYVTLDRDREETTGTMKRVGLDPALVPFIEARVTLSKENIQIDDRMELLLNSVLERYPAAKIIIIDGIVMLAPHGQINNYLYMAEWLQRAREYCKVRGVTILGIAHTSKARQGEEILDPRQKILGSVAGAGFTSCMLLVDKYKPEDADIKRRLYILPRNSADQAIDAVLDDKGCIVQDTQSDEDRKWFLMQVLQRSPRPLSMLDIMTSMAKVGGSRASIYRYLKQLVASGEVERIGRGTYAAVLVDQGDGMTREEVA